MHFLSKRFVENYLVPSLEFDKIRIDQNLGFDAVNYVKMTLETGELSCSTLRFTCDVLNSSALFYINFNAGIAATWTT